MEYIKIAKTTDFKKRRIKSFRILARPIGVFKAPDGSFCAMEAGCKHQQADLTSGPIDGDVVTCPRHGWKYNLRTDDCVWGGKTGLRRYGCKVEGEDVYITIRPLEDNGSQEDQGEG